LLKLVFAASLEPRARHAADQYQRDMGDAHRVRRAPGVSRHFRDLAPRRANAIWRLSIEHGVGWCDAEIAWATPRASID
jgi:hypothetical protein